MGYVRCTQCKSLRDLESYLMSLVDYHKYVYGIASTIGGKETSCVLLDMHLPDSTYLARKLFSR